MWLYINPVCVCVRLQFLHHVFKYASGVARYPNTHLAVCSHAGRVNASAFSIQYTVRACVWMWMRACVCESVSLHYLICVCRVDVCLFTLRLFSLSVQLTPLWSECHLFQSTIALKPSKSLTKWWALWRKTSKLRVNDEVLLRWAKQTKQQHNQADCLGSTENSEGPKSLLR